MNRSRSASIAIIGASVLAVSLLAATRTAATPRSPQPSAARLRALASTGGLPDLGTTTLGRAGWQVRSSAQVSATPARLSRPDYPAQGWLPVRPDDAGAPGTEIEALLQNGACPHVFYSDRMRRCFGTQRTGAETVRRFAVPWWYRTTFATPSGDRHATLVVNGVVGTADVWVNGHEVATHRTVRGAYTQYRFGITRLLRPHLNALAIAVHPNNPTTMFTVDNVDWTQVPPDQNTGIQFPVQLQTSTTLALTDTRVVQHDAADLSTAALTVVGRVTNNTGAAQSGQVAAVVVPPGGSDPILVRQNVRVPAGTTTTVRLTPADHSALVVRHPQLWWPYQLGRQPMYTAITALSVAGRLVDTDTTHFGIRTVTSRLVGASPLAPGGVRRYVVNGVPIVLRGGGFDPNLFLHYSAADTAHQIALIKAMGLNTLRLEGHFMPQDFYAQMDRAGILIASGYQCCDAWELPTDTPTTPAQLATLRLSAATLAQRLRSHPSVFTFQWSDNNPTDAQERVTLAAFAAEDFDVPFVASAEYKSSPQLGLSGEKEGPYDWVPPSYWYDRRHSDYANDSSLTNVGGSWALDTEQSAGHTVATRDSLDRFLSPSDERKLWQEPAANQYHANPETGTSGYNFGTLYNFDTALRQRYGPWTSLNSYVNEAQLQNYEDVRAQFEAFLDHSTASGAPSTGTIYWMANKGWPTLLWDLYNYDYDQAGSYFGAQEANRALHALYAPDDRLVTLDNLSGAAVYGLTVEARVRSADGTVLDAQHAGPITLARQQVRTAVLHPRVPANTSADQAASVYFVELVLKRNDTVIDRNTYWESTRPDRVDWARTEGNPQATMTQYADLTALRRLPQAHVTVQTQTRRVGGTARTSVTLANVGTGGPALMFPADVRRGRLPSAAGVDDQVRTATWSSNDVTLWPGERETLVATYPLSALHGESPAVTVSGQNVAGRRVAAGR